LKRTTEVIYRVCVVRNVNGSTAGGLGETKHLRGKLYLARDAGALLARYEARHEPAALPF
jgi:hypothetical protein